VHARVRARADTQMCVHTPTCICDRVRVSVCPCICVCVSLCVVNQSLCLRPRLCAPVHLHVSVHMSACSSVRADTAPAAVSREPSTAPRSSAAHDPA
jgi:hypothetical protein